MSENSEWLEGIREQSKRDLLATTEEQVKLDKVIWELTADDAVWWVNYPQGRRIAAIQNQLATCTHPTEKLRLARCIQADKREIVASYVIPAVRACVRAGYIKLAEPK